MKLLQIPESWESLKSVVRGASINDRIQEVKQESFNHWADNLASITSRYAKPQNPNDNVVRVLSFPEVSPSGNIEMIKEFDYTHNAVTNDGEIYYAKKAASESPAANENFGATTARFEMGTTAHTPVETDDFSDWDVAGTSKIAGSRLGFTGGYPKTNDTGDADNTGDSVQAISYAINYSAASWNDTTVETGCIHENATPTSNTKLLCLWSFTQFAKTASDTLKVFVNHTFENQ